MRILALLAAPLALLMSVVPVAADTPDTPFLPTWKMLNSEQKKQFVAGYVYGWQDAHKVTGIAIGYIKENPKKAVESLESIGSLYDLGALDPGQVVQGLDGYFANPDHGSASLSMAITAVKNAH